MKTEIKDGTIFLTGDATKKEIKELEKLLKNYKITKSPNLRIKDDKEKGNHKRTVRPSGTKKVVAGRATGKQHNK